MIYPIIFVALQVSKALASESLLIFCYEKRLPFPKALVTLIPEIGKAIICLIFLARIPSLKYCHLFIAHSMLFFLNNSIYVTLLQYSNASSVQFWTNLRLPATALLHHMFIRRQNRIAPWVSLMMIFIGVVLTQLKDNQDMGSLIVFCLCVLLSVNSATASVYNELLLKSLSLPFWEQQAWVSILGILWNTVYLFIELGTVKEFKALIHPLEKGLFLFNFFSVISLACTVGIVTGFLVKKFDNIVKLVSSAISTILIAVLSSVFYTDRIQNSPYFLIGSLFIIFFTAVFAKLTSIKSHDSQKTLSEENHDTPLFSDIKTSNKIRVMLIMIIILLAIGWITIYLTY